MTITVDVQRAGDWIDLPDDGDFERWSVAALRDMEEAELAVRIVGREESRRLNGRYRNKDSATNVLSFPADLPDEIDLPLLGDLVICAPVVADEAAEQGKPAMDHWAHLVVHGVLHLLGHDHQEDAEAEKMEALETSILASLGIPDPYRPGP